jgi:hypothetical protein
MALLHSRSISSAVTRGRLSSGRDVARFCVLSIVGEKGWERRDGAIAIASRNAIIDVRMPIPGVCLKKAIISIMAPVSGALNVMGAAMLGMFVSCIFTVPQG